MEHFHTYHGSLDTKTLLWRMGDGNLALVNLSNFKTSKLLPSFWNFNKKNCMPVAACGSSGMNKIAASSMASASEHIIHYWQRNYETPLSFECKDKINGLMRISCMDTNSKGSVLVLGGLSTPRYNHNTRRSHSSTMIVSISFDSSLEKFSENIYPLNKFGKPRRMKRIPGSDNFLIAALFNILVMELTSENKLHQIALLENLHRAEISDFLFFDDKLITKGFKEQFLTVSYLARKGIEANEDTDRYYLKEFSAERQIKNYESKNEDVFDKRKVQELRRENSSKFNPVDVETIKTQNSECSFEKITLARRGDYIYVGGEDNLQVFQKMHNGGYVLKNTKSK